MKTSKPVLNRRNFLKGAATTTAALTALPVIVAEESKAVSAGLVLPPTGKKILLSCKLGMIAKEADGRKLTIVERLKMAADAGFDGVDFDEAATFTPQQARDAVRESGVFVHNAINHAHWSERLTDAKEEVRAKARANLEHCLRVSHAAGGSGVLIVLGKGEDGPAGEIEQRCRAEMTKVLPLASSLGQHILVENVWNQMMYEHNQGPDQSADGFVKFVDSFTARGWACITILATTGNTASPANGFARLATVA